VFGFINTSAYGGSIIASGLAGYLYSEYGWRFVYCPLSVVVVMLAVVAWLVLKMPKEYKIIIPGKEPVQEKTASYNKVNSFLALWRLPMVLELAVAMLCNKVVRYFIYLWFPVYLMKDLSYSAANTGLLVSIFDVGGILGSVFLGIAADRYNSLVLTLLATVAGTAGFLFFKFTASWGMIYNSVMLSIGGTCVCGLDALLGGSVAVKIGEKDGGNVGAAVAGLINGFGSMGAVIQGPLIGLMSDMYGWNSVFLLVVSLLSLSSFLILKAIYMERRQMAVNNMMYAENSIAIH
jgi:sugar phosphate permease